MMVVLKNASTVIGLLQTWILQQQLSLTLVDILKATWKERYYHTIIYICHEDELAVEAYDVDQVAAMFFKSPMIQLRGNASFYLWPKFNREFLAVVPMGGNEKKDKLLLEILWRSLRKLHKTRLLLLFRANEIVGYLEEIVKFCCENKALNIVVIRDDVAVLKQYSTPRIFPTFELITHKLNISASSEFYPNQVKNLHKHPLRLSLKRHSTKSYILKEVNGTYLLGGHVGHFFDEFAKHHNASITFPTGRLSALSYDGFLENNTLDISQQLSVNNYKSDIVFSDSYTFLDWCIMVPTASSIPAYMFYAMIFDVGTILFIYATIVLLTLAINLTYWLEGKATKLWYSFFDIHIFNGMLGQPYQMETHYSGIRSILCMLICLGGLMINTTYVTYLQTFNASPPHEKPINTLNDVLANHKKILMYEDEYKVMHKVFIENNIYQKVIQVIPTFLEFYTLRDSYDTRYLYPVPAVQWSQYDEQQNFFTKRKFRLSDICFSRMLPHMIPMQANSIFEDSINEMIGLTNQAGLTNHWKKLAFLEGIQRKRLNLSDTSSKDTFYPMRLEDTKWLMYLFAALMGAALICLIVEVLWYNLNSKPLLIIKSANLKF
ncbi:uncharacterized protein [Musca autumnalis]|uniref:uncharacterized protein n=1 Tax=Musca autumnalis TaxID=221902 RepID=UPI003CE759C1